MWVEVIVGCGRNSRDDSEGRVGGEQELSLSVAEFARLYIVDLQQPKQQSNNSASERPCFGLC